VAYRLTISGTHNGQFQGVPPTDRKVSFTSTGISNIVGGKVAEDWVDADTMGFMQQLGVIPSAPPSGSGSSTSGTTNP